MLVYKSETEVIETVKRSIETQLRMIERNIAAHTEWPNGTLYLQSVAAKLAYEDVLSRLTNYEIRPS